MCQLNAGEKACDSMLGLLARAALGGDSPRNEAIVDFHTRTCRQCRHSLQGLRAVRSRMQGLMYPAALTVLLSPITAVRILNVLSSQAQWPLTCLRDTADEPGRVIRMFFHGVGSIAAAAAAIVIMVLPVSTEIPTRDSQPQSGFSVCAAYGTSLGCLHASPRPSDHLQLTGRSSAL